MLKEKFYYTKTLIKATFSLLFFFLFSSCVYAIDFMYEEIEESGYAGAELLEEKVYKMTDEKHKLFRKENREYALADTMLNFTWNALREHLLGTSNVSESSKAEYNRILSEQRVWVESGRNAVASSFSMHLAESEAFTLAIIARTQELANIVYERPKIGVYHYTDDKKLANPQARYIQGGHIVVSPLLAVDGVLQKLLVTGQTFAKSGNTCEIRAEANLFQNSPSPYEGQLEEMQESRGWITFDASRNDGQSGNNISQEHLRNTKEKPEQFYALFTKNRVYIVHDSLSLCGKNVAFQGLYLVQEKL